MKCRGCGCTDGRACEGGCYWIFEGVCSACVFRAIVDRARNETADMQRLIAGDLQVASDAVYELIQQPAEPLEDLLPIWRPGDP